VGFLACATHDELVIQSLFTSRGICVKLYLLTAIWFPSAPILCAHHP
jgi:hypothetical protein